MVLPEHCYKEIPGLILNPMGSSTHLGVTDTGEFVPKNRLTNDLSFPGLTSQSSVNVHVYVISRAMYVCACFSMYNPLHCHAT